MFQIAQLLALSGTLIMINSVTTAKNITHFTKHNYINNEWDIWHFRIVESYNYKGKNDNTKTVACKNRLG